MRAAVLWGPGKNFEVQEIQIASPTAGEVSVDLHSCGVCASDLSLTTAFGQPTPIVLGHEGAGIVAEVGVGVDSVKVGDHVVLVWVPPCGTCVPCRRGDDYLCANRRSSADARAGKAARPSPLSVDGTSIHQGMATSTFAQRTVVPGNAVVKIDADVPFPVAAMMGCAVPTGVGAALRSARVQPGDNVAVIGCGAVVLNAVMGAVVAGAARVIAIDPMESRRALALTVGASESAAPDGGHRRYSRYQLRLAARAHELVAGGTALESACRIIILEDQLAEARRINAELQHTQQQENRSGDTPE